MSMLKNIGTWFILNGNIITVKKDYHSEYIKNHKEEFHITEEEVLEWANNISNPNAKKYALDHIGTPSEHYLYYEYVSRRIAVKAQAEDESGKISFAIKGSMDLIKNNASVLFNLAKRSNANEFFYSILDPNMDYTQDDYDHASKPVGWDEFKALLGM